MRSNGQIWSFSILCLLVLSGCSEEISINTNSFAIRIDHAGSVTGMIDRSTGTNYVAARAPSPFLSLRAGDKILSPTSVSINESYDTLMLVFDETLRATVSVVAESSYVRFTITDVSPIENVDLAIWGPYATVLNDVIGETVGVVQGDKYALGLQALNPRTLGGYPWNENDVLPQLDIFESGDYSDLDPKGKRGVLYRVEAAKPDSSGSTLQAYVRDRRTDRIVANRGYIKYVAPAYDDGGIVGSSIALFGSPIGEILATIGTIELSEGLPHPMIDGTWGKVAKGSSAAYLIMEFGEDNIDRALEITHRAGLRYLYHPDAFETWGHFLLKKSDFPHGRAGLKAIVDRARENGIMIGAHILSNFITPNDPYVTPVPDPRLARVGSTTLFSEISAAATTIPIGSPTFFNQKQQSYLRASVIEDEIIQCTGITEEAPWQLTGCERGAFGTSAGAHPGSATIGKLDDHAYKVFLTNSELTVEMAQNVARLFNETGLRQISFDGLEGNRSTGMGNYGEILFTQSWFDALDETIRGHYIADASRTSHFFWHMYTRMNWGEPWYAGFRESQTEYRLKNQAYFKRNLMPAMLGWFSMRPETSIEDIEWMLARSAGFDAGYGFVTGFEQIDNNGEGEDILSLIGLWESARMTGAFSDTQKTAMQDIGNEFHLEAVDGKTWNLYPIRILKFSHQSREKQPGEPAFSTIPFSVHPDESRFEFILSVSGKNGDGARDIEMEIDSKPVFRFFGSPFRNGEHIKYTGGHEATLYSASWQKIRELPLSQDLTSIRSGSHEIQFSAATGEDPESKIKIELRLVGSPEMIQPSATVSSQ